MGMKLGDIADLTGFSLYGDGSIEINAVRYAHEASDGELAVALSRRDIDNTGACSVLTEHCLIFTDKTLLMCYCDIYSAAVKIALILTENGLLADYSLPTNYRLCEGSYFIGSNVSTGDGTYIAPMAFIGDNVSIGAGCYIGENVRIGSGTVIGDNTRISYGSNIGADCSFTYRDEDRMMNFCGSGIARIGNGVYIGSNTVIQRGTFSDTVIGDGCMIADMVNIGHDVKIGRGCRIVSQSGIAGNAVLEDNVQLLGQSAVCGFVKVGRGAVIKGKSAAVHNVPAGKSVFGIYGRDAAEEIRTDAKIRRFMKGR